MIFKDYYKILGLDSNRISMSDIKIAYKEQAKKYHPDLNGGNKKFEERFKDINEAYNILSNPNTKRRYDRTKYC
jgi:curved DNA-binding protein